jgi:hypothetical protein
LVAEESWNSSKKEAKGKKTGRKERKGFCHPGKFSIE